MLAIIGAEFSFLTVNVFGATGMVIIAGADVMEMFLTRIGDLRALMTSGFWPPVND